MPGAMVEVEPGAPQMLARERIELLLDPDSFEELDALVDLAAGGIRDIGARQREAVA